jgi:UDP:flavonoid glycosyltransferase YjiC (YdhE family)
MPITGHVRPGLVIARELARRGHDVSWYTGRAFEPAIRRAGAHFLPMPPELEQGAVRPAGQPSSGLRKLRWDVRHGFLGTVPGHLNHLRSVFDDVQPEIVVADQGFIAGPLLAEQRSIAKVI